MLRLILLVILFLFSLLILFRSPTNLLWYVAILVSEFCWVFAVLVCFLLLWRAGSGPYALPATVIGVAALVIYLLPMVQAVRMASQLKTDMAAAFGKPVDNETSPFKPWQVFTGIGAKQAAFQELIYDSANGLSLDFYPSALAGTRPCLVVIHGGSWTSGDSRQLPELNTVLAAQGYHVASVNYRLAPTHLFPAPVEDVRTALAYLIRRAGELSIDTAAFALLGRSAGGQIALTAAYTLNDPRINGVISFYGPTDMVWGYDNPTSALVLDSRKVMRDYLGGSLQEKPEVYRRSSATETAGKGAPPTLLFYAENDPLVSPRHGNRLAPKLDAAGVKHFEVYLPWATHGFDYTLNGPGGQLSTWAVKAFLKGVNGTK